MSALIGEDAKFDQEFYNSQFFAEDAEDEMYTEESGKQCSLSLPLSPSRYPHRRGKKKLLLKFSFSTQNLRMKWMKILISQNL